MSVNNIKLKFNNFTNINAEEVEEYNNGRASPVSDPGLASHSSSFFQDIGKQFKKLGSKASKVFHQSPSPSLLPYENIQGEPLFLLYDTYLSSPKNTILKNIKEEVKRRGKNDPLVQTLRFYAEAQYEDAARRSIAKNEEKLVNALKGTTLSSGGRQTKRKSRRSTRRYKRSSSFKNSK